MIERSFLIIPKYLNPCILYFRSNYIFRDIPCNGGLRLERTGRDDNVVGTINQGMAELTDDILDCFHWTVLVLIEEDIKLGIIEPKTSEVMVTWMAKVQGQEVVLGAEVLEK